MKRTMNEDPPSPANGDSTEPGKSRANERSPKSSGFLKYWQRLLGRGQDERGSLRATLQELIEQHDDRDHPVDPEERQMLQNILSFGELRTDDVMVPRADIVAADADTTLFDLIRLFADSAHSRMPLYRGELDNVIGMVHIKDLIPLWQNEGAFDIKKIVREILFVPPAMPVLDLLLKMRQTRVHMACVVDEYGGTDGLLTIEDIVEEIVGEIHDEHDDEEEPEIIEVSNGVIEADARALVEALESRVGCDLLPEDEDEEVDTLGGMIFHMAGRVPGAGEVISHPCGLEFEIVDADPRRVKRLRVRATAEAPDDAA